MGGDVCRGCKRFSHEVVNWNAYNNEQRYLIADRLESFLAQVVEHKLELLDQSRLLAAIRHQQIRFNPEQHAYCWVFDLLRAGASQIDDLEHYGLRRRESCRGLSLGQIRDQIDRDYLTLSEAHYDRYIKLAEA